MYAQVHITSRPNTSNPSKEYAAKQTQTGEFSDQSVMGPTMATKATTVYESVVCFIK